MLKVWINKPQSFGIGFNVWHTGAEIFLGFLMIVIMWYDRKAFRIWSEDGTSGVATGANK